MPRDRYDHSCGLVMNPDLGPEIIVAGGFGDGDHLDSVDIYTVNTDTWRAGNDMEVLLPYELKSGPQVW